MSAEELLESLEAQQLLSPDLLRKLRQKIGGSAQSASATSLGKYLVDRGLLTQEKVDLAIELADAPPVLLEPESQLKPLDDERDLPALTPIDPEAVKLPTTYGQPIEAIEPQSSKRYRPQKLQKNEFDTPLMLIGSGAVLLLLLVGGGIAWLLFRESGDDLLRVADEQFAQGSYTQAIPQYEKFIAGYPAHEKFGAAQVQVVLAKLRQQVEAINDYDRGLAAATELLPGIADLDEFGDARSDLAAILPKLAEGLAAEAQSIADQGEQADLAKLEDKLTKTTAGLALCRNTQYVPKSLRDDSQLLEVQSVVERIDLRRQGLAGLSATLAAMQQAVEQVDHRAAYAAHAKFLADFPEYDGNQRLQAAAVAAAKSEQSAIKFVAEQSAAETSDFASPLVAQLALANPWRKAPASATGVSVVNFMGALYGLDVATGELRWQRYLGAAASAVTPIGEDFLVIDSRHNSLLRLAGDSGQLIWRRELPVEATTPVVVGEQIVLGDAAGKLLVLEARTGNQVGSVVIAQPVRTPPAVSDDGRQLYVVGDEASLYTLDTSEWKCVGVTYLGHRAGSIATAPTQVLRRLVVAENSGVATSRLRVFSLEADGTIGAALADEPLQGIVTQRPLAVGRRLMVVTQLGAISLWDFGVGANETPVSLLAKRDATSQSAAPRYAAIAANQLWIAGSELVRFSLSPSDTQLRSLELEDDCAGDAFAAPLDSRGEVLIHARRRRGRPGVTVAAQAAGPGRLLWQTDLAAPPAMAPIATATPPLIVAATVDGQVYELSPDQVRQGVTSLPVTRGAEAVPQLAIGAARLDSGAVVVGGTTNSRAAIVNARDTRRPVRPVLMADDLAAPPVAIGDAWLAPLKLGQIYCYDSQGEVAANPFQPELKPATVVNWLPLATRAERDATTIVAIDPQDKLHVLKFKPGSPGELVAESALDVREQLVTTRAAITSKALAVGGAKGRLLITPLPTAGEWLPVQLTDEVAWGPHAAGELVLVALANGELLAYDPAAATEPVWKASIEGGKIVGEPLITSDRWYLATAAGKIVALNPADGKVLGEVDCGQTLGTGPTLFGKRLLVASAAGTVLVVNQP